MKLFLPLTLIVSILIFACSGCRKARDADEIDQSFIYTNYEMEYDAAEDLTTVKANFRHLNAVGRQLKLSGGSNVRFNNEVLPEITEALTNATYYQKEYAGMIEQGAFTWTDADGKVYNNTITLRTADIPMDLNEISSASAFELFWWGDQLVEDERVQLRFNVTGGINKTYLQSSATSESVTIPQNDLSESTPGFVQLSLERRYRPDLQERTLSGGRITAEYKSALRSVDLIE